MPPQLISGDVREHIPSELSSTLTKAGITRIDTGARYMNGESERKIGRANLAHSFTIDTKIWYQDNGDGAHTAEAIEKSLSNSLNVMGVEKVHVLYCHGPDFKTPIAVQARAFDEQFKNGRFEHLGVSNFPPWMMEEWLTIATEEGLVKPSVYEGQYNLLCRGYESTFFPLLHKHRIHFNAFSPLAGGFLLGNFTADGVQSGSRFSSAASPYMKWYDAPAMHEAVKRLREISQRSGMRMDELSLRWLVHHSALADEDGVILGASKVDQIARNVAQIRNGPLHEAVVRELNHLWEDVKEDAMAIVEHGEKP